jgi:ketosteroid isomerase-like protein
VAECGTRDHTVGSAPAADDFHMDLEELTDVGEHVLAKVCERGRGKGSGVEVERELFQLFTFRDDRIARLRMYQDEKEALEAAGLPE